MRYLCTTQSLCLSVTELLVFLAAPAIRLLCSEMMEARQVLSCSSEGCSAQDQLDMISWKQRSVTLDSEHIESVVANDL